MLFRLKPFPELVNSILDSWPSSVWKSNTSTFIDPEIGGGQFVAEIETAAEAIAVLSRMAYDNGATHITIDTEKVG